MNFAQAITDCRARDEAKTVRELLARLKKHGGPNDLGDIQALRAQFRELPGAVFDKIVQGSGKQRRNNG